MRYATRPDRLGEKPGKPDLRPIAAESVLGTGPNRMQIIPLRGETTERQLMIYWPGLALLYGSDAFQKKSDGQPSNSQAASELADAVARAALKPGRYFMMHADPEPWATLTSWLREAPASFPAAPKSEAP